MSMSEHVKLQLNAIIDISIYLNDCIQVRRLDILHTDTGNPRSCSTRLLNPNQEPSRLGSKSGTRRRFGDCCQEFDSPRAPQRQQDFRGTSFKRRNREANKKRGEKGALQSFASSLRVLISLALWPSSLPSESIGILSTDLI